MNIQLIFTTGNTADFAAMLAHCMAMGIKPQVTASPSREGATSGASTSQGKPWEASPAVIAFRAAGIGTRLKPENGETPHAAALRRLKAAGHDISGIPDAWEPMETETEAGGAPRGDIDEGDL